MKDPIQVDYEQLASVASIFDDMGLQVNRHLNKLTQGTDQLRQSWDSQSADQFQHAMRTELLPAVGRLRSAMNRAAEVTREIIEIFQQAEEEAAALFRFGDAVRTGDHLIDRDVSDPSPEPKQSDSIIEAILRRTTAIRVRDYLKSQGLEEVGNVLYERIMNGTISLAPDLAGGQDTAMLNAYFAMLLDPQNIAQVGNGAVNDTLFALAISGVDSGARQAQARAYMQQLYQAYFMPGDPAKISFWGSNCANTASLATNRGRGIPLESPASDRVANPNWRWRTGTSAFVSTGENLVQMVDYINSNPNLSWTAIERTIIDSNNPDLSGTQVGDKLYWGTKHNATVAGYMVDDTFFPSYDMAQQHAATVGADVTTLVTDNQTNTIRNYTNTQRYDASFSDIVMLREQP